jgi:hypothetical protein
MPTLLVTLVGLGLIGTALFDAFETIVLPRRVSRRLRLTRLFYWATWQPYASTARKIADGGRRETFLSFYGPLSLVLLVALWAVIVILGFAALHWAAGSTLTVSNQQADLGTDLYFSGTTFFTLGLGDVVPDSSIARWLTVIEGGTGFAFLALVIGYLPVAYQLFARRETNVSLLDQRAGSPPTATELIRRNVDQGDFADLISALHDCEIWVGDLLETHLSYPTLAYFRSQHENQSWVGALAVILDVSAFVLACETNRAARQAGFTFAIARHAVADLTNIFGVRPRSTVIDRLDESTAQHLWEAATENGLLTVEHGFANDRFAAIRSAYEPYLQALSDYLLMDLPPWEPAADATDNWESTAWDFVSPAPLFGPQSPLNRSAR